MSVTKFAFLPPNSAGATINIFFLGLYAKYLPYLVFTLPTPSPGTYISERRLQSHANCLSQFLGYWLKSMTIFENMQEEEIEILSPLFLIIDSWLWALALYGPLDSSWVGWGVHSPWGMTLLCSHLCWLENKSYLRISFQLCLCIFYLASLGRESKGFGQQQF